MNRTLLRPDSGRRPRHALLAAEPQALRQAGAERGGRALADPGHGGPAGAGDPAGAALDPHQRPPARRHRARSFRRFPQHQILAEPAQRNTAPAIGLAAHILHSLDPEAVMGVFPSDHVVGKPARYRAVLQAAFKGAAAGNLMVVGIQPRWPETGYGYIEFPRGAAGRAAPSRCRCAVSTRSPSWPRPNATWRPAISTGTPACSSGAPDVLLDQLRQHLPQDRHHAGIAAALRIARFRRPARAGISAVRQHLHRLRRDGKGRQRARHRGGAISAGTTWEAGTRSTNCCRATAAAT